MKLHLGENIRENRKKLNLTQEQLADRLGVSFQSVSRWENGTTYPDMEKLPEIARLFDTTIDALMGYAEKDEKIPIEQLDNMYMEAVGREDWEECAGIIRQLRHEYFDEINKTGCPIISSIHVDKNYENEIIKNELRLFAEAYLEKGTNAMVRGEIIHMMVRIEDEDRFGDFISQYASVGLSTEKYKLLEKRYDIIDDHEKHMRFSLYNKFEELKKFLFPLFVHRNEGDAAKWLECTKANISVLNSLCGIKLDEKHPLTGDGVVDLFSIRRLYLGEDYVTQLCGCGRYDEALTALEDMADCLEKLTAMPNYEDVMIRCPIFEGIHARKCSGYSEKTEMIGCIDFSPVHTRELPITLDFHNYEILLTDSLINWFTTAKFSNVRMDSKWLDPIRETPRYIEAVQRMIDACRNHQKNDIGFHMNMSGFDAYNKGRKAVGKEERRPSH